MPQTLHPELHRESNQISPTSRGQPEPIAKGKSRGKNPKANPGLTVSLDDPRLVDIMARQKAKDFWQKKKLDEEMIFDNPTPPSTWSSQGGSPLNDRVRPGDDGDESRERIELDPKGGKKVKVNIKVDSKPVKEKLPGTKTKEKQNVTVTDTEESEEELEHEKSQKKAKATAKSSEEEEAEAKARKRLQTYSERLRVLEEQIHPESDTDRLKRLEEGPNSTKQSAKTQKKKNGRMRGTKDDEEEEEEEEASGIHSSAGRSRKPQVAGQVVEPRQAPPPIFTPNELAQLGQRLYPQAPLPQLNQGQPQPHFPMATEQMTNEESTAPATNLRIPGRRRLGGKGVLSPEVEDEEETLDPRQLSKKQALGTQLMGSKTTTKNAVKNEEEEAPSTEADEDSRGKQTEEGVSLISKKSDTVKAKLDSAKVKANVDNANPAQGAGRKAKDDLITTSEALPDVTQERDLERSPGMPVNNLNDSYVNDGELLKGLK